MEHQIVSATEHLMDEVEDWLDREEAEFEAAYESWEADDTGPAVPTRGFRCNWNSVREYWRARRSRVDILVVDGQAIGFLDGFEILEVRPDMRRYGYGRVLAEFMEGIALEEGRSVIEIEIAPSTAMPFRTRMGYTVVPERKGPDGGTYAYKRLHRSFPLG